MHHPAKTQKRKMEKEKLQHKQSKEEGEMKYDWKEKKKKLIDLILLGNLQPWRWFFWNWKSRSAKTQKHRTKRTKNKKQKRSHYSLINYLRKTEFLDTVIFGWWKYRPFVILSTEKSTRAGSIGQLHKKKNRGKFLLLNSIQP